LPAQGTGEAPDAAPAPSAEPAAGTTARTQPAAVVAAAAPRAATNPLEEVVVRREDAAPSADAAEPRVETKPDVTTPRPTATPVDAPLRPAADQAQPLADPALPEVGATETRTGTAEHVARAEATVRHDTPRPVMQQVAEAARALRDGPVELTLQPEELGKVRMTMSAGQYGTMTMSLQAERPETLDLLRRHIGDLARELQDLGFSNLNFSFGQDRAKAGQQQTDSGADGDAADRPLATVPLAGQGLASRPGMVPVSGGLDLRLSRKRR
jgi:flagellar hook-length control protein FliK